MAKRAKFKPYNGDDVYIKKFSDALTALTGRKSAATVFADFLKIAAISISNTFDPNGKYTPLEVREERENIYLQLVKEYGDDFKLFTDMFAALTLELNVAKQVEYRDVLGQILTSMQINDESNDQFFTPTHIAELMGQLCYSDKDFASEIKQCGYCVLREPTCGGGALVFGGVEAFRRQGFDPEERLVVIATDLDERCVLMTYIQCAMYKIPAMVQQCNFMENKSLSPPWYTPMFVFYDWKQRVSYSMLYPEGIIKRKTDENVESPPKKKKVKPKPKPKEREFTPLLPPLEPVEADVKLGQLTLF